MPRNASRNTRLEQATRVRTNAASMRLLRAHVANRMAAQRRRGRGVPARISETSMLPPVPPPLPTPANLARRYRPYRRRSNVPAVPVRRPFEYYGSTPSTYERAWTFGWR